MEVPTVADERELAARWAAIREERQAVGLTMPQVANAAGMSVQNLHRYETAERAGSLKIAIIIEAFMIAYGRAIASAQREAARL